MRVEGFFSTIKNANKAVEELKNHGFTNSKVDLNEHYVPSDNQSLASAGTKSNVNLSSLVLNTAGFASDNTNSSLKAASPMVSGMGGFEEISDINYKVIVEADEKNCEEVKQIIQQLNGELKNYNLDLPKRIK